MGTNTNLTRCFNVSCQICCRFSEGILRKSLMFLVNSALPVSKAVAAIALSAVLRPKSLLSCPALRASLESTGTRAVSLRKESILSASSLLKFGKEKSSSSVKVDTIDGSVFAHHNFVNSAYNRFVGLQIINNRVCVQRKHEKYLPFRQFPVPAFADFFQLVNWVWFAVLPHSFNRL